MGGPSNTMKKQPKWPVEDVDIEEVVGTSSLAPLVIFSMDYLPPRKDDAPPINVLVNEKYPFPIAPVPIIIGSEEDMLEKVSNLKFMDHDITDTQKFSELDMD